jgi:hypothetical protein
MRRALLMAAALAIPVSGLTVALSSPAGASSATIVCKTISGTAPTGTSTISNCKGGVTGGGSQPLNTGTLAAGGMITWLSGSTTTLATPVTTATSAKKCKVAGSTADKFKAKVSADTGDGIKIPGVATGAVCVSPTGALSALKPLKIT